MLVASNILGRYYTSMGLDVKISEVHGMAQRGGSVVTYVKCGEKVYSPLLEKGGADYILAFETLEAMRWLGYLSPDGTIIVNNQQIYPVTVLNDKSNYPAFTAKGQNVKLYNAMEIAEEAGSVRAVNVVMLGYLAAQCKNGNYEPWIRAIKESLPEKLWDINIKAFTTAYEKSGEFLCL